MQWSTSKELKKSFVELILFNPNVEDTMINLTDSNDEISVKEVDSPASSDEFKHNHLTEKRGYLNNFVL